jgi:putative membrane protein
MFMRHWIVNWFLSGVGLLVVARILPGIQVDGFGAALVAALVFGIANATLGLLLKILLFPFVFLTLGILSLAINGFMLKVTSELVSGFRVYGCTTAIFGSILLTVINYILTRLV